MLVGIDVGGTFTDGVALKGSAIVKTTKKPVESGGVKKSLLAALDDLLTEIEPGEVKRVVLSTTIVTNHLAAGKEERVAVLLIPGPGLPWELLQLGEDTYFIKGWVDFRGRIVEELDARQVAKVLGDIKDKGIKKLAVICKFSNRNPELERSIKAQAAKLDPALQVFLGCEVAGRLNFPRRVVTTYYTAVTASVWNNFADEIEQALKERSIGAAIEVLKADGGTMPIEVSRSNPCETIFSGPAASTMGAVALTMTDKNAVVVDIGGTTTDISLLIDGVPLYASKGARIKERYSHINSFAVRSVPLGGDSMIGITEAGKIEIGPKRAGSAVCFGGDVLTPTDFFNYHYDLGLGEDAKSRSRVEGFAQEVNLATSELVDRGIGLMIDRITENIEEMFKEWEREPAYRIWEVLNRKSFKPELIIGIGAAAKTILPMVAKRMGLAYVIDEYSPVANALGACAARPTLALNLHVDTQRKACLIEQLGVKAELKKPRGFALEDAKKLAKQWLKQTATEKGIGKYADAAEVTLEEQFNLIRGWDRTGKIFEVAIQIAPGLIAEYKGVK